jgi:hypothetical protein
MGPVQKNQTTSHRDVLGDPQFPHYLKRILPTLQGALQEESKEINWLC